MRDANESSVVERYLEHRDEHSFDCLFRLFVPQLLAFFRRRGQGMAAAEDLAQEVMLAVHLHAGEIRDRNLFRPWLFRIARNARCRLRMKLPNETPFHGDAHRIADPVGNRDGSAAFEFGSWLAILNARERDLMVLRFVEGWEYHEIAAARALPLGTVQWQIFNAKRKLAGHLGSGREAARRAA